MSFAWSYSRLALHETCPAQYKAKHIDKDPRFNTEPGPPLIHGRRVHGGIAAYLIGQPFYAEQEQTTYTEDMRFEAKKYEKFAHIVDEIKAQQPVVEQQWGYTREYKPGPWFGPSVYFRSILDAGVLWPTNHFSAADWKTGRPKEDHVEQMETQAIAVFQRYPQVHWVETRLFYLDTGQEKHDEFVKKDVPALIAKWNKRVGIVENDKEFRPRPSDQGCKHCPLAKSKGGECAFG